MRETDKKLNRLVLVPVRAERQHIEGVVVGHPPLVAAHGVIAVSYTHLVLARAAERRNKETEE